MQSRAARALGKPKTRPGYGETLPSTHSCCISQQDFGMSVTAYWPFLHMVLYIRDLAGVALYRSQFHKYASRQRLSKSDISRNGKRDFEMKRIVWTLLIWILGTPVVFAQNQAALFFSDLTWGPKAGWEGSSTKGAAITIWGQNLGTSGTVNACGQSLPSADASKVAEWGTTTNPTVPRGLSRITFWLNSSMSATCSEGISVTSGGFTTNAVPFSIAAGNIYFVSTTGNDSNNGLYSTQGSGTNGPFRHIYKFNPANGLGDTQYIMYVRGGTYGTSAGEMDPNGCGGGDLVEFCGAFGSATQQKALIAYPGELASMSLRYTSRGFDYTNESGAQHFYMTFSKLNFDGAGLNSTQDTFDIYGQYWRFVGNNIVNYRPTSQIQSGFLWVTASEYISIFGNYFYNNGFDAMGHNIYIKTQPGPPLSNALLSTHEIDLGWNEISTPYSNENHGGAIFISRSSDTPAGAYTHHVYIHHNYFHDGTQGDFIYIADGSQIDYTYIYNNIFNQGSYTAGYGSGVFLQTGTYHVYLYNNTLYQVAAPGASVTNACIYSSAPTSSQLVQTQNNICYGLPNEAMYIAEPGIGSWVSTNELFYNPAGAPTFSGSITRTNPVGGSAGANPLFVTNGSNFNLQATSPARSAGVNLSTTLSSLPAGNMDYAGRPYPSSGAWDVGAAQYQSGGSSSAPAAPTGLTAVVH